MKEIIKEYPILKSNCVNILQLYRFPTSAKSFKPIEVKYKPTSKLSEIKIAFPTKSASALKLKNLNTSSITFKAFPSECKNQYYAKVEEDKIVLYRIHNIYLFQPYHYYYPFDYTPAKLKKAESREEFEHRMRSINFKLKNVSLEEYRILAFDNGMLIPKFKTVPVQDLLNENILNKIDFKEIEETIKRTRIVNYKTLVEIFKNEDAVKSTLFKMTERLEGRFILKNAYYERSLHDMRTKMLELIRTQSTVKVEHIKFMINEKWMIEEIADLIDSAYVLKGYKESFEFDGDSIKTVNSTLIKSLMKTSRILNSTQISGMLSISEDLVSDILKNKEFYHLSNNSYAMNDEAYILNDMFELLVDKRSFEMTELTNKFEEQGKSYDENILIEEIKKYCVMRGKKYYLKLIKE